MTDIILLKILALISSVLSSLFYIGRSRESPKWDRWSLWIGRLCLLITGLICFAGIRIQSDDWLLHLAAMNSVLTLLSSWLMRHALLEILLAPLAVAYLIMSILFVPLAPHFSLGQAAIGLLLATSFQICLTGVLLASLVHWLDDSRGNRKDPPWSPWTLPGKARQRWWQLRGEHR